MKTSNVLVVGNGSIGKRHTRNLLKLGCSPIVVTKYPGDKADSVKYVNSIEDIKSIEFAIVATPTAQHFSDVEKVLKLTNCRKILIEKPVSNTIASAKKIKKLSEQYGAEIFVAYNMRFLKVFEIIKDLIDSNRRSVKLVHIVAGQYLPEWRPDSDYTKSYSARRVDGGGVDLDLSHEIDYMNWCFKKPKDVKACLRRKISNLNIDSPDYFKAIYDYDDFVVDVELDYFRKKERSLRIIAENNDLLFADFINKVLVIDSKKIEDNSLFDFDSSYLDELKEFLGKVPVKKLATHDDAMDVLTLLMLEE